MRYLEHLSHHVLYALHCLRDIERKDALMTKMDDDDWVQHPDVDGKERLMDGRQRRKDHHRPPFADVAEDLEHSLLRAQRVVLAEYAYVEIGLPRDLCFLQRMEAQLGAELSLYASSGFYRDHLVHAMDVCLLGELLLRSESAWRRDAGPESLLHHLVLSDRSQKTGTSHGMSEESLLKNWYVAALCHDHGYSVESTLRLIGSIQTLEGSDLKAYAEELIRNVKDGQKKIQSCVTLELVRRGGPALQRAHRDINNGDPADHGTVAWLDLRACLASAKLPEDAFAPALQAILLHNLPGQKVNLVQEPVTYLLILCDHLQEWGRPRIDAGPLARSVLDALRYSEPLDLPAETPVRGLTLGCSDFVLPSRNDPRCSKCPGNTDAPCSSCLRVAPQVDRGKGLCFGLDYSFGWKEVEAPGADWLAACTELQWLGGRESGLTFGLSIAFAHGKSPLSRMAPWLPLEMDLLQEYAERNKSAAYLSEWIRSARLPEKGMSYELPKEKVPLRGTLTQKELQEEIEKGIEPEETFRLQMNTLEPPLLRDVERKPRSGFVDWKRKYIGRGLMRMSFGTHFDAADPGAG